VEQEVARGNAEVNVVLRMIERPASIGMVKITVFDDDLTT